MVTQYANQYQQTHIMTSSRVQVVVLLYDAAIQSIELSRRAIETGNLGDKARFLGRAISIIGELDSVLDYDVGGYSWTTLRTEDIGLWEMTDTSMFNLSVSAGSGGVTLTSGMVTADNLLASPVPEPATMLLLASGLEGLAGFRKRFKK